jgi:hypothetical protein
MGMILEMRDGGHMNAKKGGISNCIFLPGQGWVKGDI